MSFSTDEEHDSLLISLDEDALINNAGYTKKLNPNAPTFVPNLPTTASSTSVARRVVSSNVQVLNALPHSFIPTDYCENRGCPNVKHSHGLCVGCIVLQHEALLEEVAMSRSTIDDLRHRLDDVISINAAANLHAMQSNCPKRDSTLRNNYLTDDSHDVALIKILIKSI